MSGGRSAFRRQRLKEDQQEKGSSGTLTKEGRPSFLNLATKGEETDYQKGGQHQAKESTLIEKGKPLKEIEGAWQSSE